MALLDDDDPALFPKLTDEQLALLTPLGTVRSIEVGDVLFREGDASYDFMVLLAGRVAIVLGSGDAARDITIHRARDFMAELSILTGHRVHANGVVREAGSMLVAPAEDFRTLLGRELVFGDFILQTLFRRRLAIERLRSGIQIVGSRFDPDTHRLREFAARNRVLHDWLEIDNPRAKRLLEELSVGETAIPSSSSEMGRISADPPTPSWPGPSAWSMVPRLTGRPTTSWSWERVPEGLPPASMPPRAECARRCSTPSRSEDRRQHPPESRTTSGFPRVSRAPSSRSAPGFRPRSSSVQHPGAMPRSPSDRTRRLLRAHAGGRQGAAGPRASSSPSVCSTADCRFRASPTTRDSGSATRLTPLGSSCVPAIGGRGRWCQLCRPGGPLPRRGRAARVSRGPCGRARALHGPLPARPDRG